MSGATKALTGALHKGHVDRQLLRYSPFDDTCVCKATIELLIYIIFKVCQELSLTDFHWFRE